MDSSCPGYIGVNDGKLVVCRKTQAFLPSCSISLKCLICHVNTVDPVICHLVGGSGTKTERKVLSILTIRKKTEI